MIALEAKASYFPSRLESNFLISLRLYFTARWYKCLIVNLCSLSRSSISIVLFLSCKSIFISGFLRQWVFQETESGRKLPHLPTWIKAKAHQGCAFNNGIILLNVIILSQTFATFPEMIFTIQLPLMIVLFLRKKNLFGKGNICSIKVFFYPEVDTEFYKIWS